MSSNHFQQNSPASFGELLFLTFVYEWSPAEMIRLSLICLEHKWNKSYSHCVEAACVVCMHTFQSRREWMDVCVISAGLHILSRQSIPIKASCSPGDCRGGPCFAGSNHPLKTTKTGWLWLEGNVGSFRNEWGYGGVGRLAPSEPKELETTMAEGGDGLWGELRMAACGMKEQINYVAEIN